MAATAVLRALIALLSVPFIALSRLAEAVNLWNLRSDLATCLAAVDRFAPPAAIPSAFIRSLVVGEDHRNALHFGVDPIGIIRAVFALIAGKGVQGASTIEQQFVRVVTNRYERTARRKIREQALAVALARRRGKAEICAAYLCVASYGHGLTGLPGIARLCGGALDACPLQKVHQVIARLKYPEPRRLSIRWQRKLNRRVSYIASRSSPQVNRGVVTIASRRWSGSSLFWTAASLPDSGTQDGALRESLAVGDTASLR